MALEADSYFLLNLLLGGRGGGFKAKPAGNHPCVWVVQKQSLIFMPDGCNFLVVVVSHYGSRIEHTSPSLICLVAMHLSQDQGARLKGKPTRRPTRLPPEFGETAGDFER